MGLLRIVRAGLHIVRRGCTTYGTCKLFYLLCVQVVLRIAFASYLVVRGCTMWFSVVLEEFLTRPWLHIRGLLGGVLGCAHGFYVVQRASTLYALVLPSAALVEVVHSGATLCQASWTYTVVLGCTE